MHFLYIHKEKTYFCNDAVGQQDGRFSFTAF